MLLIKNGCLVNPKTHVHEITDILIENDKVVKIQPNQSCEANDQVIDASHLIVAPGFIDLHVHLREPGFEYKETIYTGTKACAKGGYTTVMCMPNTNPVIDSVAHYRKLKKTIQDDGIITVLPVAAITVGIRGEHLTDHEALFQEGAIALSDDGRTTMNDTFIERAFIASKKWNRPIMTHSEDHELTSQFQDTPYPEVAESSIVKRDLALCEKTQGILHVSHLSTKEAIDAIREYKARGLEVTCEAAPHHFALSTDMVDIQSPYAKVNPPIRSEADRTYLLKAFQEGLIDAIATDHAPHDKESKETSYKNASFGISGIESAFSVSYQSLVESGVISLDQLIQLLTENPAKIARLTKVGSIEEGYDADLTLIDINKQVIIQSETFVSKGKNTPFDGYQGKGEVIMTIHKGQIVYKKESSKADK